MKTLTQLSYEFHCLDVMNLSTEEIEDWWMSRIKEMLQELNPKTFCLTCLHITGHNIKNCYNCDTIEIVNKKNKENFEGKINGK